MRFVHSVWTKPMKGERWEIKNQLEKNLWLFALSVAYVKSFGYTIVLHTDTLGSEVYGQLPYDEVHLTLNQLDSVHERFWAAGKIFTYEAEPLHSIHIDGDVFLKKEEVYNILSCEQQDLVCQMFEGKNTQKAYNRFLGGIYDYNRKIVMKYSNTKVLPTEFKKHNHNSAINCGVVKFNNEILKRRYIDAYKKMLYHLNDNAEFIKLANRNVNLCPDLILEQVLLKSITDYHKNKVGVVIPWDFYNKASLDVAKKIGFTHLIGKDKYSHIPVVKERLIQINLELYNKTNQIIKDLCPL